MLTFPDPILLTKVEEAIGNKGIIGLYNEYIKQNSKIKDIYKQILLLQNGKLPKLSGDVFITKKCATITKPAKHILSATYPLSLLILKDETNLPVIVNMEVQKWDVNGTAEKNEYFWWYGTKVAENSDWSFNLLNWNKNKLSTTSLDLDIFKTHEYLVYVMVQNTGSKINTAMFSIIQEKNPRILSFSPDKAFGTDTKEGIPLAYTNDHFFHRLFDNKITEKEYLYNFFVFVNNTAIVNSQKDEKSTMERMIGEIGMSLMNKLDAFLYEDFSKIMIPSSALSEPLDLVFIGTLKVSVQEIAKNIKSKLNQGDYLPLINELEISADQMNKFYTNSDSEDAFYKVVDLNKDDLIEGTDKNIPTELMISLMFLRYMTIIRPNTPLYNTSLGYEKFIKFVNSDVLLSNSVKSFFKTHMIESFINNGEEFTMVPYSPPTNGITTREVIMEKRYRVNEDEKISLVDVKVNTNLERDSFINDVVTLPYLSSDKSSKRYYLPRFYLLKLPKDITQYIRDTTNATYRDNDDSIIWVKQNTDFTLLPAIYNTAKLSARGAINIELFTDDGIINDDCIYEAYQLWPPRIVYSYRIKVNQTQHLYPSHWKTTKMQKTLTLGSTMKINLNNGESIQSFPAKWPKTVGDLIPLLGTEVSQKIDLDPRVEVDSVVKVRDDRARPTIFHKQNMELYNALFADAYNYNDISVKPFSLMLTDSSAPLLAYERIVETAASTIDNEGTSILAEGISKLRRNKDHRVHHRHQGHYTILCSKKKMYNDGGKKFANFFLTPIGKKIIEDFKYNPRIQKLSNSYDESIKSTEHANFWRMEKDRDYFILLVHVAVQTYDAYTGLPYNPEQSLLIEWKKTVDNPLIKTLQSQQLGYKSVGEYKKQSGALTFIAHYINNKSNKRISFWSLINSIRTNGYSIKTLGFSDNDYKNLTPDRLGFVVNGLLSNIYSVSNLRGSTDQTRSLITPRDNGQLLERLENALGDFLNLILPFMDRDELPTKRVPVPLKRLFTPSKKNSLVNILYSLLKLGIKKDKSLPRCTIRVKTTNPGSGNNGSMVPIDGLVIRITLSTRFKIKYDKEDKKQILQSRDYFHLNSKVHIDAMEKSIVLDIFNPIELLNITSNGTIDAYNGESVIDRKKITLLSAPWKDVVAVCRRPSSSATTGHYPLSFFSNAAFTEKSDVAAEALSNSAILFDTFTFLKHLYMHTLDITDSLKNGEVFMSQSGLPRSNKRETPQYPWELPNGGTGIISINSPKIQPKIVIGHYLVKPSPIKRREFSFAEGALVLLNPFLQLLSSIRNNTSYEDRKNPYYMKTVDIIVNEIVDLLFNRYSLLFTEKYKLLTHNPDNAALNNEYIV